MTKKRFSPGTWKIGYDDGSGGVVSGSLLGSSGATITTSVKDPESASRLPLVVVHGGNNEGVPVGVLREEDAPLIAASKDLYNACRRKFTEATKGKVRGLWTMADLQMERALKKAERGLK